MSNDKLASVREEPEDVPLSWEWVLKRLPGSVMIGVVVIALAMMILGIARLLR